MRCPSPWRDERPDVNADRPERPTPTWRAAGLRPSMLPLTLSVRNSTSSRNSSQPIDARSPREPPSPELVGKSAAWRRARSSTLRVPIAAAAVGREVQLTFAAGSVTFPSWSCAGRARGRVFSTVFSWFLALWFSAASSSVLRGHGALLSDGAAAVVLCRYSTAACHRRAPRRRRSSRLSARRSPRRGGCRPPSGPWRRPSATSRPACRRAGSPPRRPDATSAGRDSNGGLLRSSTSSVRG